MALLERVSTLMRANLNDLLSKAEDPAKLGKQLVLDMENQLMQVKTQVAIAIADQHLLKKKRAEQEELEATWSRKAEAAVAKGQDEMARAALERAISYRKMAVGFGQQYDDQAAEAETLRAAYGRLERKLVETRGRVELLVAQHRRNVAAKRAGVALGGGSHATARLGRISAAVAEAGVEAGVARAMVEVEGMESLDDRFEGMERNDEVEALLLELKERQLRLG
ncbi:phage shock protein A [Granulicella aggregans]|uniref:Phage shock protein A n=1 Tax=Granulicella aggregans TaxID=474949 RepID=A0A7W8E4C4_9BACT|nr:PspA/IM30 family protein [Granulicella aggregans]MBB5058159.1 phage shock protein A [Granulicella aggregans]